MPRISQLRETIPELLASLLFALATSTAIVASFSYGKALAIALAGGMVLLLLLFFSGNPRLVCLWGLILGAPLDLGKDFNVMMPHMGGASSYPIELADCFMLPLIIFLIRDFTWGHRRHFRFSKVPIFWGGMILLGCITMIIGPYRHLAGFEVFRMTKCLILFWLIVNEVVRVRQFYHVIGALAVTVFIEVVIGLIQRIFKADLHLQILGEATQETIKGVSLGTYLGGGEDVFRMGALLGHPNLLAAFLALLLPMLVALLLSDIRKTHKFMLACVVLLGCATIFFTLSRSGWLAFGFALIGMLALSFIHPYLRRRYLVARLNIIVFSLVILLIFSGAIVRRLTESDPGAVNFRYEWMGIAWDMIKARPLLGFGLNSFVFNSAPFVGLGGSEGLTERYGESYQWPVVHNIYLLTWAEQGAIGFLLFVGFHLYVLWIGLQNIKSYSNNVLFTMNLGLLTGFMGLMIDGMASFFIRNAPCARVYWIAVGLIFAIYYWNRENRALLEKKRQYKSPVESET